MSAKAQVVLYFASLLFFSFFPSFFLVGLLFFSLVGWDGHWFKPLKSPSAFIKDQPCFVVSRCECRGGGGERRRAAASSRPLGPGDISLFSLILKPFFPPTFCFICVICFVCFFQAKTFRCCRRVFFDIFILLKSKNLFSYFHVSSLLIFVPFMCLSRF